MAEETTMSPITAAEPPKANPLAKPAAAHASTLKLKPVIRKPAVPGADAAAGALRPGLKLPPKPGLATAGLKLPPKPGAAAALRPGVKLPVKPVIRKPGEAVPAPSVSVAAAEKPVAPVEAAVPELKSVESPAPAAPAAAAQPAAVPETVEALKLATQSLKSTTAPIPAQAILRKTGIVADQELSEAQKQAAKSKTSRISLSEAIGAAPVKNENAPMKTIRIKRPTDIPGVGVKPAAPVAAAPVAAVAEVAEKPAEAPAPAEAVADAKPVTMTQRKTLKISRPASGAVRPAGKFGVNKPAAAAPAAPAPAAAGDAPAEPAVADIPDIPDMPAVAPFPAAAPMSAADGEKDVPAIVSLLGTIVQVAACIAMGALAWFLYQDALIF